MLKLDFTIISIEDRAKLVKDFFDADPSYTPGKHELTTLTNYILYGKDPYIDKHGEYNPELPVKKWTNMSSRKEIEIATKYSTWTKKQPASLDEALESPTFNEAELLEPKIQIKIPKPNFNREEENNLPTIQHLWEAIDKCSEKLKEPDITGAQKYKLTHALVEMRREQFTLRDIFKPTMQRSIRANHLTNFLSGYDLEIDWEDEKLDCSFAPMGVYHEGDPRFEDPLSLCNEKDDWRHNPDAPNLIDFRNKEHINSLIFFYQELKTFADLNFISSQNDIIKTINYYISNTSLTEPQHAIVQYKMLRLSNKEIANKINEQYGKTYSINYISTIYQKGCGSIAETAKRIYDYYYERINPFLFKQCSICKKMKLRNPDQFMRKARNSDGFSSKCKECEHEKTKK